MELKKYFKHSFEQLEQNYIASVVNGHIDQEYNLFDEDKILNFFDLAHKNYCTVYSMYLPIISTIFGKGSNIYKTSIGVNDYITIPSSELEEFFKKYKFDALFVYFLTYSEETDSYLIRCISVKEEFTDNYIETDNIILYEERVTENDIHNEIDLGDIKINMV